jgi:hypothetical protein
MVGSSLGGQLFSRSIIGVMLLNYDILDCIADYLTAEDLLSLCLTCKALYENLLKQSPSNIALCEKTLKARGFFSLGLLL